MSRSSIIFFLSAAAFSSTEGLDSLLFGVADAVAAELESTAVPTIEEEKATVEGLEDALMLLKC